MLCTQHKCGCVYTPHTHTHTTHSSHCLSLLPHWQKCLAVSPLPLSLFLLLISLSLPLSQSIFYFSIYISLGCYGTSNNILYVIFFMKWQAHCSCWMYWMWCHSGPDVVQYGDLYSGWDNCHLYGSCKLALAFMWTVQRAKWDYDDEDPFHLAGFREPGVC